VGRDERTPCSIKLLGVNKGAVAFHDFEAFEQLVDAARDLDW
jgi:hypothetical protein